ncbi:hypothetical protein IFM89_029539 [Coptis chinensis]|uniref:25S rRNA (uridine-N(3))-methyltransferase BMT5-like domain-containing protein n=1 Tax=Coptis chinensis TaxID=261450 RepID=A0A835H1P4_9MAGN|nr:hypothetical protein IFM89_029539 [Coptis chinensis]
MKELKFNDGGVNKLINFEMVVWGVMGFESRLSHKILLVGEGDFSFTACLANAFSSGSNMVATSLDSKTFLKKSYAEAMSNIKDLKSRGCTLIHNFDATAMWNRALVRGFMAQAKELLQNEGEIHITHKTSAIYYEWNLENLARHNGLRLIEDVQFSLTDYPGYNNKSGFGGDNNFHCYPSRTYKFGRNE